MALDLDQIQAQLREAVPGAVVDRDGDWLVVAPGSLLDAMRHLQGAGFDWLTNLTATDYPDRLEVVYNLYASDGSLAGPGLSLKVRLPDRADPHVPSLVPVFKGADFQELEAYDMFGIRFDGHPSLRRIFLWEGFDGYPLRKDYHEAYYTEEHKPYSSRWPAAGDVQPRTAEQRVRWRANLRYPEGFDPSPDRWQPIPELDVLPGAKIDVNGIGTDQVYVNIGPQHPSTHGVFRMLVGLQGETVTSVTPMLGQLHRCHEKIAERNLWTGNMPYTDRLDYLCPMYNNFAYATAVEKMMGVEVPERAEYIRVIMGELTRVVNHLLWTGFLFNDLGAMLTPFVYAFNERERVLDLFEAASGSRLMVNYFRFGGVVRDVTPEWLKWCSQEVDRLDRKLDEFNTLLTDNEIFIARARGVGAMTWQEMANYSITGPNIRAAGLRYDIRKVEPYSIYESFDFDVPTHSTGDVYDRYLQRRDEMHESIKILRQALHRIPAHGEVRAGKKAWNPKVPAGEWYSRVEHPKGELGFYLVSDGGTNAYRYHVRSPSYINLGALERMSVGHLLADAIVLLGTIDITLGEVDR
ncbi:MAG TPA: NADH-quinone oxidoreductase subunit C [Anaerolineae bacterium]|nr:NADH-quinone oxidoreductase subunit C [Anaerolineae bacterium]